MRNRWRREKWCERAGPNESNLSESDGKEVRERKRINLRKIRLPLLLLATASLCSGVSCSERVSKIFRGTLEYILFP